MNTYNWKDHWETTTVEGEPVVYVNPRPNGNLEYAYLNHLTDNQMFVRVDSSTDPRKLIPRKPAPVVVPWEPDEVPVGNVLIRSKVSSVRYGLIVTRSEDRFWTINGFMSCQELFDQFVLHQPGVPTEQCPPCGKVAQA